MKLRDTPQSSLLFSQQFGSRLWFQRGRLFNRLDHIHGCCALRGRSMVVARYISAFAPVSSGCMSDADRPTHGDRDDALSAISERAAKGGFGSWEVEKGGDARVASLLPSLTCAF